MYASMNRAAICVGDMGDDRWRRLGKAAVKELWILGLGPSLAEFRDHA